MLSTTLLSGFRKNGVPNHELILKVGNICLVTCAINGLGLANNSRVHIIAIHRYYVKVLTVGDCAKWNVRIPRISFKFRLPYGKSYQLRRLQFLLHLAYAMTYNKVNLKHCSKCFLTSLHLPLVMDSCTLHWAKCMIAKISLCIWLRNSSRCPVIQDWRISCQLSIILFTKTYWFLIAKGLLNCIY